MLAIGVPALRIISMTFLFAVITILCGYFASGLGNGMVNMIGGALRQLVVLVPCAYLLARVGQRVGNDNLVWLSYPIAEVFSLAVTLILFTKLYRNVIMEVPLHGEENEPANF